MVRGQHVLVAAVIGGLVATATVRAHHSLSTAYDNTRKVTIEAVVKEFRFTNPHPYVIVDGRLGGSTATWRLDLDNLNELIDAGMTAETFKSGDRLTVTGAPGRRQATSLYVRELDRPSDGFHYEQFSPTPRITIKAPARAK